ncbi:hypothetical protein [Mycolicibacterium hippocampi]|uniref:DNA repair helicase n=1 Tax=Mycolicibacterium hippocampi TaxID=659824 RepID=A0A850Q0T7_9MYCO|nr:hypothetical protein [Mycolicibacterium hippocampi]NVN53724.1 DNA repair helicase [Mycolicibacterium hippocampi]
MVYSPLLRDGLHAEPTWTLAMPPLVAHVLVPLRTPAHRQLYLAEQGYGYVIKDADDLLGPAI